jgi:RNA polymerase sigma-70 factor (ECF subfamily)
MDDHELLAAHVAGDETAFTTLIERHRHRLWAVALRTTGDPQDAEDALQDALISAFRRADQFRGDAAVTTWLHRIVVNASLDRIRRRTARPTVPLPDEPAIADLRDDLGQRETQLAVLDALAQLPEDQRDAVLLVDLEGYSVIEAAAILGCPEGTIKSRCSRGRKRLAEQLSYLRNRSDGETVQPPEGDETGHEH